MENKARTKVKIETTLNAPVSKVWQYWNEPAYIQQWAFASDDWHAPAATNDLRVGGTFSTTMAAKDGSFSFDFGGEYTRVEEHKTIEYVMSDGRETKVVFSEQGSQTHIVEEFDAEETNSVEMQQAGWQAILDNFKKLVETGQ